MQDNIWRGDIVGHVDIDKTDEIAIAAYIKNMSSGDSNPWVGVDQPGRYVLVYEDPEEEYDCPLCEDTFPSMPEWQAHHREQHYEATELSR